MNETGPADIRASLIRKPISTSPENLVRTRFMDPGELPLVIEAVRKGVSLPEWLQSPEFKFQDLISRHGAVLFRGFGVLTAEDFNRAVNAISGAPLDYIERSSPRSLVSGNVYTSTEHPADQEIFPHNEQSYNLTVPLKIFFFCKSPSLTGGSTPLTDIRALTQKLCPELKDRFNARKYLYVRNFGGGLGLTWQEAFQTDDRADVEAYCRSQDIQLEWLGANRLKTRQIREPMIIHPTTGKLLWFNHITFFNVSTLPSGIRDSLLGTCQTADLPNNTYYGDGQPIEPQVLDELRAAYRSETTGFKWEAGDVLALDNLSVAHSRTPFTGQRKVLVAMAESFHIRRVEPWSN